MTALHLALGLALGALGGAAHLAVTRWRASLAVTRGPALALITFPLALLGPAAAILLAARVAPPAAWIAPVGLIAARALILSRYRDDRGAPPPEGRA